jgi:hypothetical protein
MGKIGDGYGSEWQLRQYLELHPNSFNEAISVKTGATSLAWVPCPALDGPRAPREWKGIDFIQSPETKAAWSRFWPQSGNPPNWDALGQADVNGTPTWLLVEAKAHVGELKSDCKAVEAGGLGRIRETFDAVKQSLGVAADRDWLRGYYQLCNRLAVLSFLQGQGVPARLVLIYFCGDRRSDGAVCPKDEREWAGALDVQDRHVGLPEDSPLSRRVHNVFLPALLTTR